MKKTKTERGFHVVNFIDRYGVPCSLQESSLATEEAIWFGCNNANPRHLVIGKGYVPVVMPEAYVADTRMHLNRKQVAALLPHLKKFVEKGEI